MSEDLSKFRGIEIEKPSDKIVEQINKLIESGDLKPGDRLPSERVLSEQFNVGRLPVRDAIRKLEFYGILKTRPQSGTIVAGNSESVYMEVVTNSLGMFKPDYKSLLETRTILEIESAGLAAKRSDPNDIIKLEEKLDLFGQKVRNDEAGVEEDLMFHVQIAEASKNPVLKYLLSFFNSHMASYTKKLDICRDSRHTKAFNEHVVIFENIKNGEVDGARDSMRDHLSSLFDFIPEIVPD